MGDIYATSAITIIAAAGDGPDHGLAGISRPTVQSHETPGPYRFSPIAAISPNKLLLPKTGLNIHASVYESKWNTRGWTYQEAILSTRRLVFAPFGIYFQGISNERRLDDSWVFLKGHSDKIFPNPGNAGLSTWGTGTRDDLWSVTHLLAEHARKYVRRDLTYQSDTYAAFKGIQFHLQGKLGSYSFFYGLQLMHLDGSSAGFRPGRIKENFGPSPQSLAPALLWTFTGNTASVLRRPGVPSWTWLGWKIGRGREVGGPVWPRDKLYSFVSEISSVKVLFEDETAATWEEFFKTSSSSLSMRSRDEIPHLVVRDVAGIHVGA